MTGAWLFYRLDALPIAKLCQSTNKTQTTDSKHHIIRHMMPHHSGSLLMTMKSAFQHQHLIMFDMIFPSTVSLPPYPC